MIYNEQNPKNSQGLYAEADVPAIYRTEYTRDITGDACVGDEVVFMRAVFSGSYRKPSFEGYELIEAVITKDSYGADRQQHTFTLTLLDGKTTRIKGRNLYRNGLYAKPRDYDERKEALEEKYKRGSAARAAREERLHEAA